MEKRIGFDIDDVFSVIPFYYLRTKFNLDYFLSRCSLTEGYIRRFLYRRRRVNSEMIRLINRLSEKCYIVLVTAAPEQFREEVSSWLLKNRIPYNALHLWKRNGSIEEFKLRVIQVENLDYYLDDRLKIIRFLKEKENFFNCQIIHYRGQSALELEKMLKMV